MDTKYTTNYQVTNRNFTEIALAHCMTFSYGKLSSIFFWMELKPWYNFTTSVIKVINKSTLFQYHKLLKLQNKFWVPKVQNVKCFATLFRVTSEQHLWQLTLQEGPHPGHPPGQSLRCGHLEKGHGWVTAEPWPLCFSSSTSHHRLTGAAA